MWFVYGLCVVGEVGGRAILAPSRCRIRTYINKENIKEEKREKITRSGFKCSGVSG